MTAPLQLKDSFTSTGEKLYLHQSAMQALRDGKGMPIHAWLAAHDLCNHRCSFCSVGERVGDVLPFPTIEKYFKTLAGLGLKAVTLSGGGNSILYRCKETGKDFNDLVDFLYNLGLEIGVITNGMPMKEYEVILQSWSSGDAIQPLGVGGIHQQWKHPDGYVHGIRKSWKSVRPETLDKMTWCRISMSGLDANHKEQEVFVPDFDSSKTTLGFSWIMADSYEEPSHKHGWVSTPEDIKFTDQEKLQIESGIGAARLKISAVDRLPWIEEQVRGYVEKYQPGYVRLLANCLQPNLIPERHKMLSEMAGRINPNVCFSQFKPPRQPKKCWKVLPHPCLNADSFVYSCDSVVLNRTAGHKFGSQWRICHADQIGELYANPKAFNMPDGICPGCVFSDQVDLIHDIVENGAATPYPENSNFQHPNFV